MLTRSRPAIVFVATMIIGGALLLSARLQERELAAVSLAIAAATETTLAGIGVDVGRESRTLFAPGGGFGMRIDNDCNGAWAHLIFLAAVLSYPATWRQKLLGLAAGEPLLFALNIVRVASLFLLGVFVPSVFRAAHVYVWQFLIIGLALLLFVIWVDAVVHRTP